MGSYALHHRDTAPELLSDLQHAEPRAAWCPAAGITWDAFVSAADTVTIRASNITASAVDPASATYRVIVSKA